MFGAFGFRFFEMASLELSWVDCHPSKHIFLLVSPCEPGEFPGSSVWFRSRVEGQGSRCFRFRIGDKGAGQCRGFVDFLNFCCVVDVGSCVA